VIANYYFWSTIVPVNVPVLLVPCGVVVMVFPETQYEYRPSEVVTTLPEVVYVPLADALRDISPIPPVCWTTAEHVHPPPLAAFMQVTEV
jgi:hypothetical protein